MPNKTIKLDCPTCKKEIEWNETFPFKPFCSHRCKLIDLGEWASEQHRIKGDENKRHSIQGQPNPFEDDEAYYGDNFFLNDGPNND